MAYHATVLHQFRRCVPRLEFAPLPPKVDGTRRSGPLSRWSQWLELVVGHSGQRYTPLRCFLGHSMNATTSRIFRGRWSMAYWCRSARLSARGNGLRRSHVGE